MMPAALVPFGCRIFKKRLWPNLLPAEIQGQGAQEGSGEHAASHTIIGTESIGPVGFFFHEWVGEVRFQATYDQGRRLCICLHLS